ncbi:sensor histidine kinase [Enterococcus sp.]|uniref:sensor histidine kinase n=1 Tax=Enterococcus sp. TaxID=35783 RepID=UPI002907E62A|nr:histidine kinase [Enterococcus sp.]MDU5336555.1 histidine kinase [Enterococcus sp.]
MSIKRRLAFIYFILSVLLFILISISIVLYNNKKIREDAYATLSNYTVTVKQQYELQLSTYEQATTNILSDKDFLNNILTLSHIDRNETNTLSLEKSYRHITEKISNYSNLSDFYRVNVITTRNDFLTNDITLSSFNKDAVQKMKVILSNSDSFGGIYVFPNYQDIWGNTEKYLFSYTREVKYSNQENVYIQVEDEQEKLDQLLNLSTENQMSFYILDNQNRTIAYSKSGDLTKLQKYIQKKTTERTYNGSLVYENSLENGHRIIAFQELTAINNSMWNTSFYIVSISVVLLFLMYFVFKRQLNKILNPLVELKKEMEAVNIGNLPVSSSIKSEEDEIAALSDSYNGLKHRLNQSIENELIAQRKQFEANMEVLQAQIDPHFIYNIMNIVAYKGIEYEDTDTVEIAQGITEMLRYSTSNVEKQATLEQEVSHVKNYLLLMQKRYQDMLDYQVDLPEQFKRVSIPKLVLQIFVENSIKYSFDAGKESVKIQIIISDSATEEWRIAIFDDGPGISEAKIQYLERKITEIQDTLDRHASLNQLDFEIGGLGIINTYARLRLFYGKRFNLLIESSENGTKIFLYKEKEGVYK